jgi:hypothetical protein
MPLRLGVWNVNANGEEGQLVVQGIDASGIVDGSVFGIPFRGLWNEVTQELTFSIFAGIVPTVNMGGLTQEGVSPGVKVFIGYLFSTPPAPAPGADIDWSLAGYFHAAPAVGGTSRRSTLGWFAQIREVV